VKENETENYYTESDGKDTTLRTIPGRLLETYVMLLNCLNGGGNDYDARFGEADRTLA